VIERFNFYDIYGYLLPGAALLGVLWLPFDIINQSWPGAQLATTVFVLSFSYVIGHVLQTVATTTVPSKMKDRRGNLRAPSDLILDPDDTNLASKVKADLAASVEAEFGIDLEVGHVSTGSDEISSKRTDAFFLCRSLLIREKIANYAEQFEGLYAMLRGLSVAFGIGAVYLAGWGCSPSAPRCISRGALAIAFFGCIGVLASSVLAAKRGPFHPKKASADLWLLGFLLAAVFGLGLSFGVAKSVTVKYLPVFWISALVAFVASARCYSGYRAFTMHFAKAVWRDFLSFASQPPNKSKESNGISPSG
jgi:hypothetical protein